MTRAIRYLVLSSLFAGSALATPYPNVYGAPPEVLRGSDWYRQCLRVRPLTLPRAAQAGHGAGECDAAALYYDTLNAPNAGKADWQRVHACAMRTQANGVLMMLHANGDAMLPNFDLALKYACSIQSPVDEMRSRVQHLRRRATGMDSEPVDVCDDVASADSRGHCAAMRARQRDQSRGAQLAAISHDWNAKEQLGLEMASKAAYYFAQHRVDHETDAGSAGRSLQLDVQTAELDNFSADVLAAESGKLPRYSEAEFASLEERMNATYRQFMLARPVSTSYLGTIRKTGVEKTQRAWLAYRDAFELFGAIRYPQVAGATWRAMLTARRLKQLAELDNAAAGR